MELNLSVHFNYEKDKSRTVYKLKLAGENISFFIS